MGNNSSSRFEAQGSAVSMIPEKLNEILRRMMNERAIYPRSVPDGLSRQNGRGHGKAVCPTCSSSWTSYQVSGEVDLKKQRVTKVWKQKCRNCDTLVHPQFRDYEFEAVVDKLLDRYEAKLRGETPPVSKTDGSGPPHRKDLCEGCGYGTRDCKTRVDSSDSDDMYSDDYSFRGQGQMARAVSSNSVVRASQKESSELSGGEKLAIGAGITLGVGLLGGLLYAAFKPDDDDDKGGKSC